MDSVKAEKATATIRYHRLRLLTRFLRLLEACAALVALSWCSARLPVTARASGELLLAAVKDTLFMQNIGNGGGGSVSAMVAGGEAYGVKNGAYPISTASIPSSGRS